MNQQKSKLISASTGHDCAAKQAESTKLAVQVAEFLKAGGKVKEVDPVRPLNSTIVHGTKHGYFIAKCRCGKCIKWANKNLKKGDAA